ncbi:MAG: CDP-alcohol phosphatidyltransferase family protein [Vicinamibacterales bacterium]
MLLSSHVRHHRSLLAAHEKRLLIWMAERLPLWLNPDHLSALGLLSMVGAGLSFFYAQWNPGLGLPLVVAFLALNWFGDSLDGTIARVRNQQRPRYGFYVDHVIDLAGTACLFAGLAASGFMSPLVAALVVAGFFLVSAEAFLATHTRGIFRMAFARIGPTELRLLLAAGALALLNGPSVDVPAVGELRLFDLGGVIGAIGMAAAFVVTSSINVRALYLEETRR